jgi:SAM-dependent methyltransferase
MLGAFEVYAVDDHAESIALARTLLPEKSVICSPATNLPFEDNSATVITALDVLEHIEDDAAAANEIYRVLKPGGVFVSTVPALMALWSDWDVKLHHFRRYQLTDYRGVLKGAGFKIQCARYINVAALPAVWAIRQRAKNSPDTKQRAEDSIPPAAINRLLHWQYVTEATISKYCPIPGVGILAVATKPKSVES